MIPTYSVKQVKIFRIAPGEDLLEALRKKLLAERINAGMVSIIGALSQYKIGYYDQEAGEYKTFEGSGDFEILHCTGNVSMREGKPFPHIHITLADTEGKAFGGHVFEGCKVFVAEVILFEFDGPTLARMDDKETKLALWPLNYSKR